MRHRVLAQKYRPQSFTEVMGQPAVVRALSNALEHQQFPHASLLTGTRGVGKTSLARIIAKCLNCEKGVSANPCNECNACVEITGGRFPDLIEVDAASRTKVEETRELLEDIPYAPSKGRYKVYLIDEVHMLSNHSFNALLKTLEEPPKHVFFLLATTDPQKCPATILSRCLQFHLKPMPAPEIVNHLKKLLAQENIQFENPALNLIANAADGSMRDALSLLEQVIHYSQEQITEQDVRELIGALEPMVLPKILTALADKNGNDLVAACQQLEEQGANFLRALNELLACLHQITLIQVVNGYQSDTSQAELLQKLAKVWTPEEVQLFYQMATMGLRDLSLAPTPRMGFEITLLRMLAFYPLEEAQSSTPVKSNQSTPTATPKVETQTSAPATHKVAAPAPLVIKDNWHEIIPDLKLSGAALILAQQCSLVEKSEGQWNFHLNQKQKPLLQPKQIERISAALSDYLKVPTKVAIQVGEHTSPTPAEIANHQTQAKQHAAQQEVLSNPQVQKLMETFEATLSPTSIVTKT